MQSIRDILALWDTYAALGAQINVPPDTIRKWAKFGRIPAHAWTALIGAAAHRGVTITAAQLLALSAPRKPRSLGTHRTHKPKRRKRSMLCEGRP